MAEELDSISKKLKDVYRRNNEADFRDRWRKQLSIVIQSCNSHVILKQLSKLFKCNFDDYTYDRDHSSLCSLTCLFAIVTGRVRVQI